MRVLSTFGMTVPAVFGVAAPATFGLAAQRTGPGGSPEMSAPGVDVDLSALLHGSQELVVHRPIPVAGEAIARTRVVDVHDKGDAAGIVQETEVVDLDDRPLYTAGSSIFAHGEGGFGGRRGPSAADRPAPPSREPDAVLDTPTLPQQALLYQLCGERNPLHADLSRTALKAAHDRGDRRGQGVALNNPGLALQLVRRFEEAITAHEGVVTQVLP
ncbi:MaoC family dehydratase N-terminal domain-containing protein [Actinomadura citrea]|uniref:FAS1-like dehydratase domain-containing protein n=1 Tax=Actinomadura citrea TaxID=46158 RepID=UPI002E2A156F|nr:MaoC family dehydratase N-terminal domain-containing protein [Actinomadura citrea]